jgi:hypothetical protein
MFVKSLKVSLLLTFTERDETQVVVGHDRRVHVWRKADEIWRHECDGLRGGPRVAVMLWGCITFDGVGTLTDIEGNMNTTKYLKCHI